MMAEMETLCSDIKKLFSIEINEKCWGLNVYFNENEYNTVNGCWLP